MAKTAQQPPALPRIFAVRGKKVVLDSELAKLSGGPTFCFNEVINRNGSRFLLEFRVQLMAEDVANVKPQTATSTAVELDNLRSQSAILKSDSRGSHRKYATAFDEKARPKIGFHRGNR